LRVDPAFFRAPSGHDWDEITQVFQSPEIPTSRGSTNAIDLFRVRASLLLRISRTTMALVAVFLVALAGAGALRMSGAGWAMGPISVSCSAVIFIALGVGGRNALIYAILAVLAVPILAKAPPHLAAPVGGYAFGLLMFGLAAAGIRHQLFERG